MAQKGPNGGNDKIIFLKKKPISLTYQSVFPHNFDKQHLHLKSMFLGYSLGPKRQCLAQNK